MLNDLIVLIFYLRILDNVVSFFFNPWGEISSYPIQVYILNVSSRTQLSLPEAVCSSDSKNARQSRAESAQRLWETVKSQVISMCLSNGLLNPDFSNSRTSSKFLFLSTTQG